MFNFQGDIHTVFKGKYLPFNVESKNHNGKILTGYLCYGAWWVLFSFFKYYFFCHGVSVLEPADQGLNHLNHEPN